MEPLAAVRAVHFAAVLLVAGAAAFPVLVAEPVWRPPAEAAAPVAAHRKDAARLIWAGLGAALASGAAWLVLLAGGIGAESWGDALSDGTAWAVLTDTRFGALLQLRALLAAGLAGLVLLSARLRAEQRAVRVTIAAIAAALLGSLAWAGHAGGAPGGEGDVHLIADVLHLLAGGLWIGGLVPLALLLSRLGRTADRASMIAGTRVLQRFSTLGVVAVAALVVSGVVNTWYLTAHMRALLGSSYGQVLLAKVGLFLAMLAFAADNRLRLLPRVAETEDGSGGEALRRLRRNTTIEIALGLAVICVVGVLGQMPPAGHVHAHGG